MKDGYELELKHVKIAGESVVSIEDEDELVFLTPIMPRKNWHPMTKEDHLEIIWELFK